MKLQFAFLICVLTTSSTAYAASETVETAVGKLIVSHDKQFSYSQGDNSFGIEKLYNEFDTVYQNQIKHLSVENRVDFLWASMWHLGFDGHAMYEFQSLIAQDCAPEFIKKLELYIGKEEDFQRDKSRLLFSKKVLAGLKGIVNAKQQTTNK